MFFVGSRACVATHYVRTVKCTIVCGFRVRSTDPVLDWIVKSEANYICENHFRPPGSDSDGRYWDSVIDIDIDIFPSIFSIRYRYSILFSGVTEYTEYELKCMLCHMIYAPTKHIH